MHCLSCHKTIVDEEEVFVIKRSIFASSEGVLELHEQSTSILCRDCVGDFLDLGYPVEEEK